MHKDALGSVDTITNESGIVIQRLAYDAFGKRIVQDWINDTDKNKPLVKRGYTGHEHIEEFELIHMNGRIYDPVVGRFLSADPLIQAPLMTQSFNRYSYTMNNPLRYTDPSGYFAEGSLNSPENTYGGNAMGEGANVTGGNIGDGGEESEPEEAEIGDYIEDFLQNVEKNTPISDRVAERNNIGNLTNNYFGLGWEGSGDSNTNYGELKTGKKTYEEMTFLERVKYSWNKFSMEKVSKDISKGYRNAPMAFKATIAVPVAFTVGVLSPVALQVTATTAINNPVATIEAIGVINDVVNSSMPATTSIGIGYNMYDNSDKLSDFIGDYFK